MVENNQTSPTPQSSSPLRRAHRGKRDKEPLIFKRKEEIEERLGKSLSLPHTRKISGSRLLERLKKEEKNGCTYKNTKGYRNNTNKNDNGRIINNHEDYFSSIIDPSQKETNLQVLEEGGVLFSFTCKHILDPFELDMVGCIANLSCFKDETIQNYVPHLNIHDANDVQNYTYLLTRCAYLLPGIEIEFLTPALAASIEYHSSCQPDGTFIWTDCNPNRTQQFRFTKPIIRYIYSITVQFRVSPILSRETLQKFSKLLGMEVTHGLLMERTKRSVPPKQDSTQKAKSVLLYTPVEDGVLVHHLTVLVQSSLPFVIEKAVTTFGSWGLGETIETASRTRKYLRRTIPSTNTTSTEK